MATRANIGYKQDDGSYRYIYTHWDGYPSHMGTTLLEHYTDPEKIKRLVENGSLSSIGPECDGAEGHTFNTPVKGQTIYYGRDRGETDVEPKTTMTRDDIHEQEFAYVYENGYWICSGACDIGWIPLSKAVLLEN